MATWLLVAHSVLVQEDGNVIWHDLIQQETPSGPKHTAMSCMMNFKMWTQQVMEDLLLLVIPLLPIGMEMYTLSERMQMGRFYGQKNMVGQLDYRIKAILFGKHQMEDL